MVIEYGRKPYIRIDQKGKKVSYQESMRLTSDEIMRTRDIRLQQHSEFKKPYMTSSYQAMEKLRSLRVFNFNYGNFNLDFDFNVVSYPKFEGDPGKIWRWNPLLGYLEPIYDDGAVFNPCGKIPDDCFQVHNLVLRSNCIKKWTEECGRWLPHCLITCTAIDCETREITCKSFTAPLGCWPGDIQLPPGVTQLDKDSFVDTSIFGVTFKLDENINYFKICICGNLCCDEVNFTDDCDEDPCLEGMDCSIAGSDTITTSDTNQLSATGDDCDLSRVIWGISGQGATISETGLITTDATACGSLKVTIDCLGGDRVVDTFYVRVTDCGSWSTICDSGNVGGRGRPCTTIIGNMLWIEIHCCPGLIGCGEANACTTHDFCDTFKGCIPPHPTLGSCTCQPFCGSGGVRATAEWII